MSIFPQIHSFWSTSIIRDIPSQAPERRAIRYYDARSRTVGATFGREDGDSATGTLSPLKSAQPLSEFTRESHSAGAGNSRSGLRRANRA
jgi:hypothetical protein